MSRRTTMDGDTAVAHVAYRTNEVCAIFPITPSPPMADLAERWASEGLKNIWGNVPAVQDMQAEGGAAGTTHGALQSGAVTTTLTASQGLMLMLPDMFKIAGELTSTVFHVAAGARGSSTLPTFGGHADVMTTRPSGFALFCSGSVQEAHDSALIAQMATLEARVPFVHFFDGFATSHEQNALDLLSDADIRAAIDDTLVRAHRARGISPENPFNLGTAQQREIFFQACEAAHVYYDRVPGIVEAAMRHFAVITGRSYRLFDYTGDADADRVMILMGSGAQTARAAAAALRETGEKIGVLQVRLYRPFSTAHLLAAMPASVRGVVVLDRTKEPGGIGEPLFLDIVTAFAGAVAGGARATMPLVIGGRYGVSSKDFTPFMAEAAFDELRREKPRIGFTVGFTDDGTHAGPIPAHGTFPSRTAAFEKRNISGSVPVWREDLCVQCGQCSFVCPHSVIRAKYYDEDLLVGAPPAFKSAPVTVPGHKEVRFTLQFYVEDCTGCGLCVEACPEHSPSEADTKAINMAETAPDLVSDRANIAFFEKLPVNDRASLEFGDVRGVQFLEPLFEFSAACGGCGETPYLKLLSQLFGDRLQIANATGCASIYGANLPVSPWRKNAEGRGPAWSNTQFEKNAESGLGFRLAADKHLEIAHAQLAALAPAIGPDLADAIRHAPQFRESDIRAQRVRVAQLKTRLLAMGDHPAALDLLSVVDSLVRRSIWIVGGNSWAHETGPGGLDHVLASGRDVNVLVLDTEVYANTGGQAARATLPGALATFAAARKRTPRKDLGMAMIAHGNVYVAQVAMGANPRHTLQAFREAEAYPGPSIVLAYSQCVAHGVDMRLGMKQQDLATASGYWPLFRFNPEMRAIHENPFRLDSPRPRIKLKTYAHNAWHHRNLATTPPDEAEAAMAEAQAAVTARYRQYEELARHDGTRFRSEKTLMSDTPRLLGAAE